MLFTNKTILEVMEDQQMKIVSRLVRDGDITLEEAFYLTDKPMAVPAVPHAPFPVWQDPNPSPFQLDWTYRPGQIIYCSSIN
jgi:hypothetical protein